MRQVKVKKMMSILEAVDFLSSLAEIDVTLSPKVLSVEEKNTLHPSRWLDHQLILENQEIIQEMFFSIHYYIKALYEKNPEQLKDLHVGKGILSIASMMHEACAKIDQFTELFKKNPELDGISELKEYKELHDYIQTTITPHLSNLSNEENWAADLGIQEEDLVDVQKKGIRDLEDIKEDKHYELFYIKKEDRKPFYDYDMVRRLKLFYNFEQMIDVQSEDPFIRIRHLQDKDFHQKAISILQSSGQLVAHFYKESIKIKGNLLVASLHKALMALMIAANPRNLQGESHLKSSSEYFEDFHFYLRESLHTAEYKRLILSTPETINPLFSNLFLLINKLCASYFLTISLQKEMVQVIRKLIQTGSLIVQEAKPKEKKSSLWRDLLWEDQSIRATLQKHPNGPIKRVIESFLKGDIAAGWDPLSHKNTPTHLFTISKGGKEVTFLRMPAPLKQTLIQKAEMTEEFESFLKKCFSGESHQKFLLVNLQDRTSWEEHARAESLENLAGNEQYARVFDVIGLPKQTDFYFQRESYIELNDAVSFQEQLIEQFEGKELCGFYWPQSKTEDSSEFVKKSVKMIHEVFFDKNKKLTVSQRQDFIEIFYFFLILKAMDLFQPSFMTLSCKDAIDTGAASIASFYSCFHMLLSNKPWKEEEKDFLLWILYSPALFFRERAIQKPEVERFTSSMLTFQEGVINHRDLLMKACKTLYQDLWEEIELKKVD